MAAKKKVIPPPALDALDQALKNWSGEMWTKMVLWKNRNAIPELTVQVTEKDILGWQQCIDYLGITTQLRIYRPQGRPAQAAIPEVRGTATSPGRSAIPARAAEPPRPFILVQLLDQDGNTFRAIENSEEARREQERSERLRAAKDSAKSLAAQLQHDMAAGVYSNSVIGDAAQALLELANA